MKAKATKRFRFWIRAALCASAALWGASCICSAELDFDKNESRYLRVSDGQILLHLYPAIQGLRASYSNPDFVLSGEFTDDVYETPSSRVKDAGLAQSEQPKRWRLAIEPSVPVLLPPYPVEKFTGRGGAILTGYQFALPLIWPTIGLAGGLYWFERRARAQARLRAAHALCDRCGYILDGLAPGATCPECGQGHAVARVMGGTQAANGR